MTGLHARAPARTCPECGQPVEAGVVRHRPCMLQHEQDRLAQQDARDRLLTNPPTFRKDQAA